MKYLRAFFFALSLLAVQCAIAHDDATLDAAAAPHGGQLRMAGPYHFELVTKSNELSVYVTDHAGEKVSTRGVAGSATLLQGKTSASIPLRAVGDNLVNGSGKFDLAPETGVMVTLTFPGKSTEMANFMPLKKAGPPMRHAMQ